jgi:CubicO group peptidase (beta-lactamase class C family)
VRTLALLCLLPVLCACSSDSKPLHVPPAQPGSTPTEGLGWLSRVAIDGLMRASVATGSRSGYVAVFARDGHQVYANSAGWADIEQQRPMQLDTRMRFASMTKPMTAVAAMILVERGLIALDDPVASYIPAFAVSRVARHQSADSEHGFASEPLATELKIRHLLMFAAGIGPGREPEPTDLLRYWQNNAPRQHPGDSLAAGIDNIAGLPLFEQPGVRWRYGWSADVLARVVEVASGMRFDDFLSNNLWTPLGMEHTHFRFADEAPAELATVYTQDENGDLVPIPEPDSDTPWPEGGSGTVSTAEDYLRFALMLYNEGEYQGTRILEPETVQDMRQLHLPSGVLASEGLEGIGWGLGMAVVADADATPFGDRDGDFWWSGYFGTTFFVSPTTGLVGVVLSQNEPGPHSDLPLALYAIQGLAFMGL